jgi:hypothetical protein
MDKFKAILKAQINSNRGRNLFKPDADFLIGKETCNACSWVYGLETRYQELLIDYAVDNVIQEFCRVNQYYSFNSSAKSELKTIYSDLLVKLNKPLASFNVLSNLHNRNLIDWLTKYNPFAKEVYQNSDSIIKPVPCDEYSVELQMEVLRISSQNIKEPVLDIGCGQNGFFVNHLAQKNIHVIGFDRNIADGGCFSKSDWLEYDYEKDRWGLIISNLGFSNHFNHHHLRKDGNYIEYAKTFMRILQSLKKGGSFHYAPDLPFIENYIDNRQFVIKKHVIKDCDFKTTIIVKLK